MKTLIEKTSDKLVKAFLKNKIIAPIPSKYTKQLNEAQKLRKLCESKIKEPVIGFKAAGTGIPLIKKFKEKEPFYASVYKRNFLKSGKSVKINKGDIIGTVGSTGRSTGPHLDFRVNWFQTRLDPMTILN